VIFVQLQSIMIITVSSEMNWTDIAAQTMKNLIWLDSSSTRQDKNRLRKLDWST